MGLVKTYGVALAEIARRVAFQHRPYRKLYKALTNKLTRSITSTIFTVTYNLIYALIATQTHGTTLEKEMSLKKLNPYKHINAAKRQRGKTCFQF